MSLLLKIKSFLRNLKEAIDWVFGFDFFISYSNRDGDQYPASLRERLQGAGFSAFLDKTHYVAGDDLDKSTTRRVRMSQQLILVLCGETYKSTWVQRELKEFLHTNRGLVIIDVNGSWENVPNTWPLRAVLEHRIRIPEQCATANGEPSDKVIGELTRSFKSVRREVVRKRLLAATTVVFLIIALVAVWQSHNAISRLRDSQTITMRVLTSIGEFQKAEQVAMAGPIDDPRFDLAQLVMAQHMPFATTVSTTVFKEGIFGLAFDSSSELLMAVDANSVIQLDPETGNVLRRWESGKNNMRWGAISALGEAGRFFVRTRDKQGYLCDARSSTLRCDPLSGLPDVAVLEWLTGTNFGVASIAGKIMTVVLEGGHLLAGEVISSDPLQIQSARSGMALGLFSMGTSSEVRALVSIGADKPIVTWLDRPIPSTDEEPVVILSNGMIARFDGDRLQVMNTAGKLVCSTRQIASMGSFLGFVESSGSSVMLMQPFDRKLETGARLHILSLGSGSDIVEPTSLYESVWAYTRDSVGARHWFGGQDGRVVLVRARPTQSVVFPESLAESMIPTDEGILVKPSNPLDRRAFFIDYNGRTLQERVDYNPFVHDNTSLHWQDYPFAGAVSPLGRYVVVGGDTLRVLDTSRLNGSDVNDVEATRRVAQEALTDAGQIVWTSATSEPQLFRWVSDQSFISNNFHKELLFWSLNKSEPEVVDLKGDGLTSLSTHGTLLVSTYSGNVWTIDGKGNAKLFASLDDLVHLFALDDGSRYVAHMRNPDRTAFLVRSDSELVEVVSIVGAKVLRNALVAHDKIALLYDREVRLYEANRSRVIPAQRSSKAQLRATADADDPRP